MNNGHSSGYFPLNRGTCQGDPLSAYLFILVLKVMLIQIRENDNIKGINIGNYDIKLSAFADDTYFLTFRAKLHKPLECGWINIEREKILVLGIYLSYNQSLVENCNFLNMLSCIKESLNLWECKRLTLAGRIQIFKSLALSKTIYASTMIRPSKKVYGPIVLSTERFHLEGKTSQN